MTVSKLYKPNSYYSLQYTKESAQRMITTKEMVDWGKVTKLINK